MWIHSTLHHLKGRSVSGWVACDCRADDSTASADLRCNLTIQARLSALRPGMAGGLAYAEAWGDSGGLFAQC